MLFLFSHFKAVRNSLKKVCKCHGVTGSCTMKTCWNTLPTFQEVAENIYDQYFEATRYVLLFVNMF